MNITQGPKRRRDAGERLQLRVMIYRLTDDGVFGYSVSNREGDVLLRSTTTRRRELDDVLVELGSVFGVAVHTAGPRRVLVRRDDRFHIAVVVDHGASEIPWLA